MELSKRLQAVADLVTPGYTIADVGTDHAYIPIYLVEKELFKERWLWILMKVRWIVQQNILKKINWKIRYKHVCLMDCNIYKRVKWTQSFLQEWAEI